MTLANTVSNISNLRIVSTCREALRLLPLQLVTLLFLIALTDVNAAGDRGATTAIPSTIANPPAPVARELIVDGKVLIRRIEVRGDALFPEHGITNEYLRRRLNRYAARLTGWMSVSDMHRLADDLTVAYHEKGLTFNQVFVLPQEIVNNTLTLNVLAGQLSEVNVMNNKLYGRDQIVAPFAPLLGKVIYEPDVKLAMEQLNRMPGLKVFGFYSMGRRQGETRLNLRVQAESPHSTRVRADNWGVQDTGVARLIAGHSRNNISGRADTLQAIVMATNESGNLYGGLHYAVPWSPELNIGAGIMHNQFEIAGQLADFGLDGQLFAVSAWAERHLLQESNASATLKFDVASKQSTVTSDEFRDVFNEATDYTTLETALHLSVVTPELQISQNLQIVPVLGLVMNTDDAELDSEFYGLRLQYSIQHLWMRPLLKGQLSSLTFSSFITDTLIPDAERVVLTGGHAVRGYKPALFSADQTIRFVFEHSLAPFAITKGLTMRPFFFVDAVDGQQNDEYGNTAQFIASGIGLEAGWEKSVSGGLTAGFPVSEKSSAPLPEDDFSPVIFGYLTIQF